MNKVPAEATYILTVLYLKKIVVTFFYFSRHYYD